jgi:hypothetical protein
MAPRSKGPVVDTQMPSMGPKRPSLTPSGGVYGHNKAPFDAPQSMGNGGVPTKFFDDTLPAKVGRTTVSGSGVPASNLMSPGKNMPARERAKASPPKNNK